MNTENIVKFLQTAYSDEKLAALLAHAQDGKLVFSSCCCIAGIPTAGHALRGAGIRAHEHFPAHPMNLPYPECKLADAVSHEFLVLGEVGNGFPHSDSLRRERIIPIILAEISRREKLAEETAEQERLEEVEAEREGLATETSGYPIPEYERNGR